MEVAIKKEFGIGVNLKEGHGGIFEVAINDKVVYSNSKQCGRLPEAEEIFQKIREYEGSPDKSTSSARGDDQDAQTPGGEPGSGCTCPGGAPEQGGDAGECRPPPPDDASGGGGGSGGSRGKTLVFVTVMLIAIGVASYSFSKKYMTRTQDTDGALGDAAAFSCGVTLSSLKALDVVAADEEAVFVILAGESEDRSSNAYRQVDAVVKLLSDRGKKVAAFTLEKHREGYDHLVRQFSVKSFPCVVVAGRGCGSVAVSGQITENKLLAALVQASMPPSSCGTPAGGSSCCPK